MAELTLISSSQRPLQLLVAGTLQNDLRLLEVGIRRSEQRLQEFEVRYGLSTSHLAQQFWCPSPWPSPSGRGDRKRVGDATLEHTG